MDSFIEATERIAAAFERIADALTGNGKGLPEKSES
jgi:hypothetical protein